jgi:hypothetical protein
VLALGALGAPGALDGCSSDCERSDEVVRWEGGITDASGSEYQSSPRSGPLLHFPAGRRYSLAHGLSSEPGHVEIWLAFSETGSLAPSAGNQSIVDVVDREQIVVKNDTCAEFWLWLLATRSLIGADAGSD